MLLKELSRKVMRETFKKLNNFYIARYKIILLARARYAFTLFSNQLSALQQLTLITQQVHIYTPSQEESDIFQH